MPRVFIAISVAAPVRAALTGLPHVEGRSWRRVREEHFHITLKFLGDIPEEKMDAVGGAVEAAVRSLAAGRQGASGEGYSGIKDGNPGIEDEERGMMLSARGIGGFPNVGRARVLWAGVSGDVETLREMQERIGASLEDLGFPKEKREFTPHITLARSRGAGQSLPASWQTYSDHKFGRWRVDGIQVIESVLASTGPRYIVRHEVGLGGVSAGG